MSGLAIPIIYYVGADLPPAVRNFLKFEKIEIENLIFENYPVWNRTWNMEQSFRPILILIPLKIEDRRHHLDLNKVIWISAPQTVHEAAQSYGIEYACR